MTTEQRKRRLEAAIEAVEAKGNTFMAANLKKALRELLEASQRGS